MEELDGKEILFVDAKSGDVIEGGIIVNEERAMATPCHGYDLGEGKKILWSKGVIGVESARTGKVLQSWHEHRAGTAKAGSQNKGIKRSRDKIQVIILPIRAFHASIKSQLAPFYPLV